MLYTGGYHVSIVDLVTELRNQRIKQPAYRLNSNSDLHKVSHLGGQQLLERSDKNVYFGTG